MQHYSKKDYIISFIAIGSSIIWFLYFIISHFNKLGGN